MTAGMWFKEDVQRILDVARAAGSERGPDYHLAIDHIAKGFGLEEDGPPYQIVEKRHAVWLRDE